LAVTLSVRRGGKRKEDKKSMKKRKTSVSDIPPLTKKQKTCFQTGERRGPESLDLGKKIETRAFLEQTKSQRRNYHVHVQKIRAPKKKKESCPTHAKKEGGKSPRGKK